MWTNKTVLATIIENRIFFPIISCMLKLMNFLYVCDDLNMDGCLTSNKITPFMSLKLIPFKRTTNTRRIPLIFKIIGLRKKSISAMQLHLTYTFGVKLDQISIVKIQKLIWTKIEMFFESQSIISKILNMQSTQNNKYIELNILRCLKSLWKN